MFRPVLALSLVLVAACSGASDDAGSGDAAVVTATDDRAPTTPAPTESTTSSPPASSPSPSPSPSSSSPSSTSVDASDRVGLELAITPAEHSTLAAELAVTSDVAARFSIRAESTDGHVVTSPRTIEPATTATLPLVGLRADRDYDVEVRAETADGAEAGAANASFSSGPLPDFLPEFELELDADRMAPGVRIIEVIPFGEPGLPVAHSFAVDEIGEVVWYFQYTTNVAGLAPTSAGTLLGHMFPVGALEFDVLGNVLTRWQPEVAATEGPPPTFDEDALARAAGLDGRPGDPEITRIDIDGPPLGTIHHEFVEMPGGTLLFLSTRDHELTDEQRQQLCPGDEQPFHVVSDVAIEMERDGTVLRSWDIWDMIDINATPGSEMCNVDGPYASDLGRDWAHANGLSYDPRRDIIVMSSRHTDQLIAFNHLDDLGPQRDLAWVMGTDGTLPIDGDQTYHQHAPEFQEDGSLLVYDNGNDRPDTAYLDPENPMYSRAVRYDLDLEGDDPADWSATQVWEHIVDDPVHGTPLYAYFVGDADRLPNGNVLIDHGGIGDGTEVQRTRVIEVVPASAGGGGGGGGGEIVFDLRMGTPDYPTASYRSVHLESLYFGDAWQAD